jgi:serine/threonine-protein kinase
MPACLSCGHEVLDIDVRCMSCGTPIGTTGAHRMIGNVILGQYEIVDVLGQGGMSIVYRARHKITEQDVALKLLPPELAAHSQVKSRFLEEARALAQLDHPNIVHLYNFGQENGAFVLAMQFVAGETWERMIMTRGRQEWPVAARIAIDVLRALEYAHGRGIIHRDMKPSNVLVRASDGAATVMDFGIAKMTTSTRLTATGQTMGTVRYMSPEQVRGQEVDVRTDLYSLGATIYEAVVGDTPFDGNTHFEIMTKHLHEPPRPPSVLGVEIPPGLETSLLKALSKKPDDRFQTARDFRKALEEALTAADLGLAETQRLARDSVSPVHAAVAAAAGRPSPAGPAQPTAPLGPKGAPAPATAMPSGRGKAASGIADQLEPDEALGAAPRRRTWLWLGLGGLVAAAGAVVAVMMLDRESNAGSSPKVGKADAAATTPPKTSEFLPPDLPIVSSEQAAKDGITLTVHVSTDWAPSEVIHNFGVVRERLERFATEHAAPVKVPTPLSIVVVPGRVFCDPRTYENGEVPGDCQGLGFYYRPVEQTLLVLDDRPKLETHLGIGLVNAACIHQGDAVCALVEPFERQLRK